VVVVGAAVLFALGACGQRAEPAGAGSGTPTTVVTPTEASAVPPSEPPTSPPVTVGPSGTVVPPGVTVVPKDQVDSSALPEYHRERTVWVFDGGLSLQLYVMANNGCAGVEARVVDQSADAVRILVRSMDVPQGGPEGGGMCTQALEPKPVTVRLDAPLGDRLIFLAESRR
jgi:hypothetical protein